MACDFPTPKPRATKYGRPKGLPYIYCSHPVRGVVPGSFVSSVSLRFHMHAMVIREKNRTP